MLLRGTRCAADIERLSAAGLGASATDVVREGRSMHRISFDNNSMTGTLPGFLIHYPSLSLALPDNLLTGTLPDWTNNGIMEDLDLSGNRFHGTLPILFTG